MSCNKCGKSFVNYLTPAPGGTATSASYNLGLTYDTCGNRQMCVNNGEGFPIAKSLDVQALGAPRLIGNDQYCCDVRCVCDVVYQPVGQCSCPRTETVVAVVCVPCGQTAPTLTANGVLVDPVGAACGCSTTSELALTISFTVETTA